MNKLPKKLKLVQRDGNFAVNPVIRTINEILSYLSEKEKCCDNGNLNEDHKCLKVEGLSELRTDILDEAQKKIKKRKQDKILIYKRDFNLDGYVDGMEEAISILEEMKK